ncbi:unnamed protein product [Tilletia laevis]|uniref:Methyltransferase domain-containing protein n=2 Tax=Tilletia TaxID=13289 RepID=A0A177VE00_9BASI|nr:hypothetical protein CF336_g2379 [Tilletia laevis]KAE8263292.1 hypothetical protein A4X03_0g1791 [Tilletia caries]CAD6947158.1 unnamed protein product [Tilletia controversa]KAE8205132.1 hypothetical protein CF335_g2415 [Tilletia laevis]CAD6887608.1 unnamed protein product [Tilletia caries]
MPRLDLRLSEIAPFRNPTASLPRLKAEPTLETLDKALLQLCVYYAPSLLPPKIRDDLACEAAAEDSIDPIRADVNERRYAGSWLMKLIALEAGWLRDQGVSDAERENIIDRAGQVVAAEAQIDESEAEAIFRTFIFPLTFKSTGVGSSTLTFSHEAAERMQASSEAPTSPSSERHQKFVTVRLRDEPLPPSVDDQSESAGSGRQEDGVERSKLASYQAATAVGVQTWAAAAFLSDWLLKDITRLHPSLLSSAERSYSSTSHPFRTLELGAGTGLVGLALAKHFSKQQSDRAYQVCLTDIHEQVLDNLRFNVDENREDASVQPAVQMQVESLDWEEVHTCYTAGETQDIQTPQRWWSAQRGSWPSITAADCIYSPDHARWLASTMAYLLCTPDTDPDARAVMIMANRTRGRFGEWELRRSVESAFAADRASAPSERYRLTIVDRVELPRVRGLGRDDEDGYVVWTFAFRPLEKTDA